MAAIIEIFTEHELPMKRYKAPLLSVGMLMVNRRNVLVPQYSMNIERERTASITPDEDHIWTGISQRDDLRNNFTRRKCCLAFTFLPPPLPPSPLIFPQRGNGVQQKWVQISRIFASRSSKSSYGATL